MDDHPHSPSLEALCAELGLASHYDDFWGHRREVPPASLRKLLKAMGIDADTDEAAQRALAERRAKAIDGVLPAAVVVRQGQARRITARIGAASGGRDPGGRYTRALGGATAASFGGPSFCHPGDRFRPCAGGLRSPFPRLFVPRPGPRQK